MWKKATKFFATIALVSIFLFTFLPGCYKFVFDLDGKYDNNYVLADYRSVRIDEITKSVCKLETRTTLKIGKGETEREQEVTKSGSGIVVFGKYIITARHVCFLSAYTVPIMTPFGINYMQVPIEEKVSEHTYLNLDGELVKLKKLVEDKKGDFIVLEVPDSVKISSFPYEIGNSDELERGNVVYLFGNPRGIGIQLRAGIVTSLEASWEEGDTDNPDLPDPKNLFISSAWVDLGDSGGPVLAVRDGKYELIGFTSAYYEEIRGLSMIVKINVVMDKLKDHIEKEALF